MECVGGGGTHPKQLTISQGCWLYVFTFGVLHPPHPHQKGALIMHIGQTRNGCEIEQQCPCPQARLRARSMPGPRP